MSKNKKKILYFVEALGGGVFTYITNLANNLSDDFDIYVAYGVRPQTPDNVESFFNKDVHLIRVKNFKRQISSTDVKAFCEMKNIVHEVKPDTIHLHSSKAGFLGRWAFRGNKVPVFYTPHGYSFLMENITPKRKFLFKLIEKVSALRNCTTISCSYGEDKETRKLTKQALYVDNGINVEHINHILSKINSQLSDQFTIFTLGRISEQKNPQLFNKIAEAFPNIRFVWIGDGELRGELTASNIKVTGWLNIEDALKLAINYNAFLLTSEWEGLPMALLEAMYIEKPCIVSNVIGNNNVITNNVNGFLCNDLNDYLCTINELVNNDIPKKLLKNAKKDIVEHYNSKVMARKYSLIYKEKLQKLSMDK